MELWELVRRLLAGAVGGGASHLPGAIAGAYRRDLIAQNVEPHATYEEFSGLAEQVADDLLEVGLIRPAGVHRGGAAILGAMERTDFGDELFEALQRRNVVALFEGMQTEIEAGDIRRKLHQLNS